MQGEVVVACPDDEDSEDVIKATKVSYYGRVCDAVLTPPDPCGVNVLELCFSFP